MMRWFLSDRADPQAAAIADRHYNRQKIGSPQFVPPGRCVVLITEEANALWVTSYPYAEYVKHAWAGAWVCSCFRNESPSLASELIAEAVAATRWYAMHCATWQHGCLPERGFVSFVDASKVRSVNPGYCYKQAGWRQVGHTKGGLVALQLLPHEMPEPMMPRGAEHLSYWQGSLWEEVRR